MINSVEVTVFIYGICRLSKCFGDVTDVLYSQSTEQ